MCQLTKRLAENHQEGVVTGETANSVETEGSQWLEIIHYEDFIHERADAAGSALVAIAAEAELQKKLRSSAASICERIVAFERECERLSFAHGPGVASAISACREELRIPVIRGL